MHPFRRRRFHGILKRDGKDISDALVRTPRIVMDLDQFEDVTQVPFPQENKVVECLADFLDMTLSKGVATRRSKRRFLILSPSLSRILRSASVKGTRAPNLLRRVLFSCRR
jgi:hypothetical protein